MPAPPVSGFHAVFVFLALAPPFSMKILGRGGMEIGAVEILEGVHAVASTTDFLRLLSYISGLVGQPPGLRDLHAMTITRPRSLGPLSLKSSYDRAS